MTWGAENQHGHQGFAFCTLDRRYWCASWTELWDTLERDGYMMQGSNCWFSWGGKNVSYPYAVMDDFGTLVAVSI